MDQEVGGSIPPSCTKTMWKNKKKLKPNLPSGFVDKSGKELAIKDKLVNIIKKNFELFGFSQLETPSFEISENIGKFLPDEGTPMSGVFGFKDGENWLSLRYDLTAPLARFFAKNEQVLTKPFKRYQIGTVWRNEKPESFRYREFLQIDADIIGVKNIFSDYEICTLLTDTLNKCVSKTEIIIEVNNRKLISGLLEKVKIKNDRTKLIVLRAIDKLKRLNRRGVRYLLGQGREDVSGDYTKGAGLSENQMDEIMGFLNVKNLNELNNFSKDSYFLEGLNELKEFFEIVNSGQYSNQIRFSPQMVRGLEYYTGIVFEAFVPKVMQMADKSVGGGGRYDNLVSRFTDSNYGATGVSIGLSRLITLAANYKMKNLDLDIAPVLISVFDKNKMSEYLKLLNILRKEGINSEIYLGDGNLNKQLGYANKKNTPAVIIYGDDEIKSGTVSIKDFKSGAGSREDLKKSKIMQKTVKLKDMVNEIKKII